jgi:hypothetical protein
MIFPTKGSVMTMERRSFLTAMLTGFAALPVLVMSKVSYAARKLVSEDDPVAKALKYVHDASKSKLRTNAKMGVAAKDQHCSNCAFFTAQPDFEGKKVGNCTMIAAGYVEANGWCNSWAKKA